MLSLQGKVVAITGASTGIGEAATLLLAERGAQVVLGARQEKRLQALATRIEAQGGAACYARTVTILPRWCGWPASATANWMPW